MNSLVDSSSSGYHTALIIIDMISCWDFPDAEKLAPNALKLVPKMAALKRRCKKAKVPVIYANDNRGQWRSDFTKLVFESADEGNPFASITQCLAPTEEDYFILKPKQSAFFGTPLELLLQHLHVKRILLTGVSSDQCVLATAIEAGMRDIDVVVPRDCIATQNAARNAQVISQLNDVHNILTPTASRIDLKAAIEKNPSTVSTTG